MFRTLLIVLLLRPLMALADSGCDVSDTDLQPLSLQRVVDGDSLDVAATKKLRVIGINAPELYRGAVYAPEPWAEQARAAAEIFLSAFPLYSRAGSDPRDHYGRQLSHVYRLRGGQFESLAAHLLTRGLAWQVVVPANSGHWRCYRQLELQARGARRGLWSSPQPRAAATLEPVDAGFQRLRGRVSSVVRVRGDWWLQLGPVAVRVSARDLHYFSETDWRQFEGRELTLRGWLIDRSDDKSLHRRGFSALMLKLRHPSMLEKSSL